MAIVWVFIWLLTAVSAYFTTKAAIICCSHSTWDKPTKEFVLIYSLLLGPLLLLISLELFVFAAISNGLTANIKRLKHP